MIQEARILLTKLDQQQHVKGEFRMLECTAGKANNCKTLQKGNNWIQFFTKLQALLLKFC